MNINEIRKAKNNYEVAQQIYESLVTEPLDESFREGLKKKDLADVITEVAKATGLKIVLDPVLKGSQAKAIVSKDGVEFGLALYIAGSTVHCLLRSHYYSLSATSGYSFVDTYAMSDGSFPKAVDAHIKRVKQLSDYVKFIDLKGWYPACPKIKAPSIKDLQI